MWAVTGRSTPARLRTDAECAMETVPRAPLSRNSSTKPKSTVRMSPLFLQLKTQGSDLHWVLQQQGLLTISVLGLTNNLGDLQQGLSSVGLTND